MRGEMCVQREAPETVGGGILQSAPCREVWSNSGASSSSSVVSCVDNCVSGAQKSQELWLGG